MTSAPGLAARFGGALAGELTKIRTVRSTRRSLLAGFLLCVCLGYFFAATLRAEFPQLPPDQRRDFDPLYAIFYSLSIGQLAIAVFGVTAVGGEYATGTIAPSLTAVPRRWLFYAAKITAGLLTAAATSAVTVAVTLAAGQLALGPHRAVLSAPGIPEALLGAWLYLTLICGLAMGLAAALRNSGFTLGILLPLLFLDSQGLGNVPGVRGVVDYLPDQAGAVMMHLSGPAGTRFGRPYGPWAGMGIMLAWTAVALAAGYVVLARSDLTSRITE